MWLLLCVGVPWCEKRVSGKPETLMAENTRFELVRA